MINICSYTPEKHNDNVLSLFKSRPDIFPKNEIKQLAEETKSVSTDDHLKIVSMQGESVAGYTAVKFNEDQNRWDLHWLAVGENFQHQGVASSLLKYISDWLVNKNVNKLYVETCSCDGEAPARAFYTKNGFNQVMVEKDGYNIGHSKITFIKNF